MTGEHTCELRISAGTGPVEARRFVASLARTLARACTDAGLELLDEPPPLEQAASIELRVRGDASALARFVGTHALLCDSRRDRSGRRGGHRKRWFAEVSTSCCSGPEPEPGAGGLDPADVELSFARAGGPGGQHVNKAATAVRALHRPSGLAVRVAESRSQAHNRELALVRLAELLRARSHEAERLAERERRARRRSIVRGDPVAIWRLDRNGELAT